MTEQNIGVMRIEISDNWSVGELADLLKKLDYIYRHLNAFLPISKDFDQRIRSFTGDLRSWHKYPPFEFGLPRNLLVHSDNEVMFEPILASAARATSPLALKSIEAHSPGFLEVLGSVPVLTLIATLYYNYRKDETERLKIKSHERIEKRKSEVEQSKVYAEVLKTLTERERELTQTEAGELMEHFIDLTREQPVKEIKRISIDRRIGKIEIVERFKNEPEEN